MTDVNSGPEAAAGSVERQCYICLEVGSEESRWVSPCRCTGSMAWVHQHCLLHWIRDQELRNVTPVCKQCLTAYVLLPVKGPLVTTLDFLYKHVVPACKHLAGCFFSVIAFESACATAGLFLMTQVYGKQETVAILLMDCKDIFLLHQYLKLITCSLVMINYLPWKDCLLRIMRKSSRLPILRAVLPADLPALIHESSRKSTRRILADTLLLPVFANIVGNLFFSSVESPLTRVLVGGAVYLTVECSFYMYLKQKLLRRQHQLRVLPVSQSTEEID